MKYLKTITVSALAFCVVAGALAQTLYSPFRTLNDQGIATKSWGSGTIGETDEFIYDGTVSVRVSSRNFYQGGILEFTSPVSLNQAFDDRTNLLRLTLMAPGYGAQISGGATAPPTTGSRQGLGGSQAAGGGGGGAGGDQGGQMSGGLTGGQEGGAGGGPVGPEGPRVEKVRIVITTTDGMRSEAYLDLTSASRDDRGWMKAGIPLQAINGFDRTNKIIQSIAISTDKVASVYIGEIDIQSDATPIFVEPNIREANLALGDTMEFWANGFGGATPLQFTWSIAHTTMGGQQRPTVRVEGQLIEYTFRQPGTYVITLTASDIFGLKEPQSATINISVNP